MHTLDTVLGIATALAFTVLAAWALQRTRLRSARRPARWFAASFAAIAAVTLAGAVVTLSGHGQAPAWLTRIELLVLVFFPYGLWRFAITFRNGAARRMHALAGGLTAAVGIWGLLLPRLPGPHDPRPSWMVAYTLALLAQWAVLLLLVTHRLWVAGTDQPGVVRGRMRMMAAAAVAMAVALLAAGSSQSSTVHLFTQLLSLTSGVLFFLGYRPPDMLVRLFRTRDEDELRLAVQEMMESSTVEEVLAAVLPRAVALVGGQCGAFIDFDGTPVACHHFSTGRAEALGEVLLAMPGEPRGGLVDDERVLFRRRPRGWLLVGIDPVTPFFGVDETKLLDNALFLLDIAVGRIGLLERERQATRRLQELDRLKSEFVAMVAHDLRSPMSVISGFADTLRLHGDSFDDAQRDQFLEMISDTTKSLAVLVEDVLQVARIESGEFQVHAEPFPLCDLIDRVCTEQRAVHPAREIVLRVDEGVGGVVLGDRDRVWQVLTNLVTNALKFSPPEQPVEIVVAPDAEQEGMIATAVVDHGMGIRPEDQGKLFRKFSRIVPPDGAPKVKGTGLGLFICKSIIEAIGGRIEVESAPGEGSTFRFTLPAVQVREEVTRP